MYALRPYQQEAVDAVYKFLREKDTNPCVVIPTAGGKSLCLAQVAKDAVTRWNGRVMILAHVKELVEQNAAKIRAICPELKVGVYSAGLGFRDTEESVIVAGIQSVFNKMRKFKPFDIVMVDEVHMVPPDGEGRYRTFLKAAQEANPNVRLIGWTATPYRTQGGYICKPENLFNEICYEVGVKDLIDQGYISKISSKGGRIRPDLSRLHVRAGEFVQEDVEEAMGDEQIVRSAAFEIVQRTADRKTCLVFCTSIEHCERVAKLISNFSGEECAIVTGDTPAEKRAEIIARLRGEKVVVDLFGNTMPPLRYCCNVAVMTTGTDIPGIDTVALLRPTMSPGLLVQMVGRGFRLSPQTGKTECLVLDYGRNIERFGPIDMIDVSNCEMATEEKPLVKDCPECQEQVRIALRVCPNCGHYFPPKEIERKGHEDHAADVSVVSGEVRVTDYEVEHTEARVWEKRGAAPGAPRTVRVEYYVDMIHSFSEWLCPEHDGYARRKFEKWWREHAAPGTPLPQTAEEVTEHFFAGAVRPVKKITVRSETGKRYPEILGYELGEIGEGREETPGIDNADDIDVDDIPF